MVNSNKALASPRDLARWFDRPREVSLKRLLAGLRYPPVVADRYLERVRAIAALAHLPDFDLYGEGWSHRHPAIRPEQHALVQRVHRGTVPDKHSLLGGYKFALVIENTRFPGYVSEKLFDCFFAGCIPVYDGAPDIDRLVRTDAFIDARRFRSYAQLERCLRNVTEMEAGELLNAGRAYIRSPAFQPFCAKNFAREIVEAVLS
jgi:hypothetical protein